MYFSLTIYLSLTRKREENGIDDDVDESAHVSNHLEFGHFLLLVARLADLVLLGELVLLVEIDPASDVDGGLLVQMDRVTLLERVRRGRQHGHLAHLGDGVLFHVAVHVGLAEVVTQAELGQASFAARRQSCAMSHLRSLSRSISLSLSSHPLSILIYIFFFCRI